MVSPLPEALEQIRGERSPESRSTLMDMFIFAPDEEILEIETIEDLAALSRFPGN
jgi:hypothetical protein